ncbi:MAG: CBS domain-containing protein [Bacillus sp. (in: firmicutes)]
MFVKSIMIPKHHCHVAEYSETLESVMGTLEKYSIDAMPVLKDGTYVGIITRNGIYESFFRMNIDKQVFLGETVAGEIVTKEEDALLGNEIFEQTLLQLKDCPLLPVVDGDGQFLGIVTRYDVLEQFQSAFGMRKKGVRIAFTSVETEGRLARLLEIAHQYHEHIISLVTFDEGDELLRRMVLKIEKNPNIEKFTKKMESSGFRILHITED